MRRSPPSSDVDPGDHTLEGRSRLTLKVLRPIERIQFDLDANLPVSAVRVGKQRLERASWRNPDGRLTIDLGRVAKPGELLAIAIAYAGKPHVAAKPPWEGGFVWSKTPASQPWVATAVQGEGCDLFWPCFDNSLVEVGTVDLDITVPKGLAAPSNGRLLGITATEDGRPTYHWRTRRPNNYAIALNVGPYKELRSTYRSGFGNSIPLHYWYLPGEEKQARALFAEFAPTLDFFEATVGPYPFSREKVGVVGTPHLGMEHQTINAYGNAYKQAPEGFDWLFHDEFTHEWFGNQLTNRDWDDMWLHEGLGSYMQPLYVEQRVGRMAYDAWMWRIRGTLMNKFALVTGRHRLEHQVYDKATGPGLDIYNKGAWMLHTLRGQIGDEALLRSIRRTVYGRPDPAPGNFAPRFGTSAEFIRIASQESGRDLNWFFDVYLKSAALPRLVEDRRGKLLTLQWRTPRGLPFPMPVEVAVDGELRTVPMERGRGQLALPSATSRGDDRSRQQAASPIRRDRPLPPLGRCRKSQEDTRQKLRRRSMSDALTFYTNPMSRGQIVRWMLEEVGQPYETQILDYASSMKGQEYLAINPMGKVPALRHGDRIVTECAAIIAYLADVFPDPGLAPREEEKADYYRWLFYAAGPVEQAVTNQAMGFVPKAEQSRMAGYGSYDKVVEVLEKLLDERDYACGDRFTACDVYLGSQIMWGTSFKTLPERPSFLAYADRLGKRDVYRRGKEIDNRLIAEMQPANHA